MAHAPSLNKVDHSERVTATSPHRKADSSLGRGCEITRASRRVKTRHQWREATKGRHVGSSGRQSQVRVARGGGDENAKMHLGTCWWAVRGGERGKARLRGDGEGGDSERA